MTSQTKKPAHIAAAEKRAQRLAEELRANLQRRKQQGRARRAGEADPSEGLPASSSDDPQSQKD